MFKTDVRVEGVPRDAIFKDEEQKRNQRKVREFGKRFVCKINLWWPEERKKVIWFAVKNQVAWFTRWAEDTINRIKARFPSLIAPYYLARVNRSSEGSWRQERRPKAQTFLDPEQVAEWRAVQNFSVYNRVDSCCRYLSRRSTSLARSVTKGIVTIVLLQWKVTIQIFNRDRRREGPGRETHGTQNLNKNWDVWARFGEHTSQHRLRPLLRHGRRAGGKTLNGTITRGKIINCDQWVRMGYKKGFLLTENHDSLQVYTEHLTARTFFSVLSVFVVFCTFTCTYVRVA